jgi:pimeloyl-ACP methyl ester carboxylesterase
MEGLDEPDDVGTSQVAEGRRLAWAAWGPTYGHPVLFFSGAGMGRRLGFGSHLVERLGIRLIAVDRPGVGASDPSPDRTLTDWAADVRRFVTVEALADPVAVAFSMGGPFGLACAAAGVVGRLALVSAQDDFAHDPTMALLPADVAGLVRATVADPSSTEHGFADADAASLQAMVLSTASEADRRCYADEPFASRYAAALGDGFAPGAAGYARDLALAAGRWPFEVEDIDVPVDLWYGAEDASPVHSPDLGATLARRLPDARRHVVADVGSSVLWLEAEAILTAVTGD